VGWNKYRLSLLAVVTVATLILDQWTKYLVHSTFKWGESVHLIPGFFSLTYVRNTGAAFGLMHKAPAWFREPFFIVVPIVALFIILSILAALPKGQKAGAIGLSMVFAGAVGNLIDRLRLGYVIDFLDFYLGSAHWPAFNVADMCIVGGVTLLFILSITAEMGTAQEPGPPTSADSGNMS